MLRLIGSVILAARSKNCRKTFPMQTIRCSLILSLASICLLPGCGDSHADSASGKPPPAIVTAGVPVEMPIADSVEYTGRLDAVESVEIRARATGFLTK